ncbi:MAG TPA: ABC transporter ATP-binding protein [Gemmataceae bacterium]|nr:ABC transporter ATP-binding protein [Gemmataceae bacterium]
MDKRAAFARARSFLNYHRVAKWSALVAGVGTAVFYILLLMVLGLFADLMVSRGEIPAFHSLSGGDQRAFKDDWKDPLSRFSAKGPDETATEKDKADFKKAEKQWKAQLKDLGIKEEDKDAHVLKALQLRSVLNDLGCNPDADMTVVALCLADPAKLDGRSRDLHWELLWRVGVYQMLQDRAGDRAAKHYANQFAADAKSSGLEAELQRPTGDLGMLSFVFRTQHRFDNWLIGLPCRLIPWLYEDGPVIYLTVMLVLAIFVAFGRSICSVIAHYMAAWAVIGATTRLRRAVYHHTYRLGTLAFKALGPSEAVSVSTRHLEVVHEGLFIWLTIWIREPVKFGLLLAFSLAVNFWLALAFLMFAVLVWLCGGQIAAWFRERGRIAQHRAAEQLTLIQESLTLMRLVKVYLMELFNQSRVERQLAKFAAVQNRRYLGEAIYRPVLVLLGLLAALVLLYVAGIVVIEGSFGVSAASAVTLAVALVSLYWPIANWLDNRKLMRRARYSATVLFNFLDRSSSVGQAVEAEFLPPLSKHLEFDNVTLNEPGTGRKLLKGVSLTVRAGQRVALVGPDEMQKHALVYLIPRFLDPTSGEIRIDRKNLRWVTFDSLRASIAVVLQHNLVFNDTVANNIGCGDPSYQMPKIIEAAKVAHCHKFIQELPQGYETPIGDMGQPLSISQQFRIALARAILRDPALMIVEEPYLPLDDDSKALLDDTFNRVLPGRTAIFLPHRLSTIRNCDKVFLLYEGRVEASGDHRELLAASELYRHLQYLEFNEFGGLVNMQPAPAGATADTGA